MAYPGAAGAETLSLMAFGPTAPFFWLEVVAGLLVPFCILVFAKNRQRTGLVLLASALVILGVFCKRCWLLLTSFIVPNVQGANGITLGTLEAQQGGLGMWALGGSYAPTWTEVVIVLGVVALGALAFILLSRKLLASKPASK